MSESGELASGSRAVPVPKGRLLLLMGAGLSLLAGLDAALLRLGLVAPVESGNLADYHGILMLYGFLGTAILLERAVALQSDKKAFTGWGYIAPTASVGAVVALLLTTTAFGLPGGILISAQLWAVAFGVLVAMYAVIWKRQQSYSLLIEALGAVAGLAGIVLWGSGMQIAEVFPWWAGFLILTIVGERLELARVAFTVTKVELRIFLESAAYVVTIVLAMFAPEVGYPLMGLTLGILVIDVGFHDVARRTINSEGIAKFAGASMLAGYGWALVASGIWIVRGPTLSGYGYDAVVHAITIGFALSMVMAHAPIIVPAIVRRAIPYHRAMWAVWGVLQAGLLIRILAGARAESGGTAELEIWQFGGALDIFAVLAFVVTTLTLVLVTASRDEKVAATEGTP